MIRPWTRHLAPARSPRILFALRRRILYGKLQHFALRLSIQISLPATKTDTPTSPNSAPATKSDTATSPNSAPATKSDTATSPNLYLPRKATLQQYQIVHLPRRVTELLHVLCTQRGYFAFGTRCFDKWNNFCSQSSRKGLLNGIEFSTWMQSGRFGSCNWLFTPDEVCFTDVMLVISLLFTCAYWMQSGRFAFPLWMQSGPFAFGKVIVRGK